MGSVVDPFWADPPPPKSPNTGVCVGQKPPQLCLDVHYSKQGTTIFPALKSSLYHSKEFSNPQQFDPGHFLDANGAPRKTDFFIPFSVGKYSRTLSTEINFGDNI